MSRLRYQLGVSLRKTAETDILYLADNLRQSDIDELAVTTPLAALDAVIISVQKSDPEFLFSAFSGDKLLCIGGCSRATALSDVGIPWLLATPCMDRYAKRLTVDCMRGVRIMLQKYRILENVVDARNTATIRWLEAIGFTMGDTIEIMPGYPVIKFEMSRESIPKPPVRNI